jgi:hypothetical protein
VPFVGCYRCFDFCFGNKSVVVVLISVLAIFCCRFDFLALGDLMMEWRLARLHICNAEIAYHERREKNRRQNVENLEKRHIFYEFLVIYVSPGHF